MKIAWLTDIHLNFLHETQRGMFYQTLLDAGVEAIVISGDIGEADDFLSYIAEMESYTYLPINFVLGNHDYYHGSITDVREGLKNNKIGIYLPGHIVHIGDTAIVGQDGFADTRCGDFDRSQVILNDHLLIKEFADVGYRNRAAIKDVMRHWGDNDAFDLGLQMETAIEEGAKRLIVVTHIPPFEEVCLYRGRPSGGDYLPFYCSFASGSTITREAKNFPDIPQLVLCGHTHGKAHYKPLPNVEVYCGGASYGHPRIAGIIDGDTLGITLDPGSIEDIRDE